MSSLKGQAKAALELLRKRSAGPCSQSVIEAKRNHYRKTHHQDDTSHVVRHFGASHIRCCPTGLGSEPRLLHANLMSHWGRLLPGDHTMSSLACLAL